MGDRPKPGEVWYRVQRCTDGKLHMCQARCQRLCGSWITWASAGCADHNWKENGNHWCRAWQGAFKLWFKYHAVEYQWAEGTYWRDPDREKTNGPIRRLILAEDRLEEELEYMVDYLRDFYEGLAWRGRAKA